MKKFGITLFGKEIIGIVAGEQGTTGTTAPRKSVKEQVKDMTTAVQSSINEAAQAIVDKTTPVDPNAQFKSEEG